MFLGKISVILHTAVAQLELSCTFQNKWVKSFWRTLKNDLLHITAFPTRSLFYLPTISILLEWVFCILFHIILANWRQEDGSQAIGRLISVNHRFASHICTCLDYARNNSILKILEDTLCLSHTSLPSINAVYIFSCS